MSTGIIIQARTGSTRLPKKMIREFFNSKSLLEVILIKLLIVGRKKNIPVILATTENEEDDVLIDVAQRVGVKVFRGSENDVLSRFIEASKNFKLDKIIRVCGDNPFLLEEDLADLIDQFEDSKLDYLSYKIANTPSILTHFGLWTEAVKFSALEKAADMTDDKFYHEHVTNFIYNHPESFEIDWIPLENERFAKKDIRLTIDTEEDFNLTSNMHAQLIEGKKDIKLWDIINYIDSNPELLQRMKLEIESNSK